MRRHIPAITVTTLAAAFVFLLGYIGLFHTVNVDAPDIPLPAVATQSAVKDLPDITGTYDVPGGSLTVYSDTTARFAPDPSIETVGACRTFVGSITITQCVPVNSPEGGHLTSGVHEDGSAGYSDGTTFDPDTRWFYESAN